MSVKLSEWGIYKKKSEPHNGIDALPPPPPWRDYKIEIDDRKGASYQPTDQEVKVVNLALYLRRPILVFGDPGCGKSSLAFSVALQLKLGKVLHWPINSRTTVKEGIYEYDAIARLRDANLDQYKKKSRNAKHSSPEDIGQYIRLKQFGTAMISTPNNRPRVLLIDEIDKSNIDFPNDLLHIFEEGQFVITELLRISKGVQTVKVTDYDSNIVPIKNGRIQCLQFPLVIMTSNQEREFPPAFLRRCLQLKIHQPDEKQLNQIIDAHMKNIDMEKARQPIAEFITRRKDGLLATDQLLNALSILAGNLPIQEHERKMLIDILLTEIRNI